MEMLISHALLQATNPGNRNSGAPALAPHKPPDAKGDEECKVLSEAQQTGMPVAVSLPLQKQNKGPIRTAQKESGQL
jgi:hypothetical protein